MQLVNDEFTPVIITVFGQILRKLGKFELFPITINNECEVIV